MILSLFSRMGKRQLLGQEVGKDVGRVEEGFLGPDLSFSDPELNVA